MRPSFLPPRVIGIFMMTMAALVLTHCDNPKSGASSVVANDPKAETASSGAPATVEDQPALEKDGTLVLPEPSQKALAIQTAVVQRKNFSGSRTFSFEVFREADEITLPGLIYRTGFAYALTLLGDNSQGLHTGEVVYLVEPPRGGEVSAQLVEIDALPGSARHQQEGVLEIPDQAASLELSQSVTVSVPSAPAPEALVIPQRAVLDATAGTFAYLQTSEGFKRTPIQTGLTAGSEVQVIEGLKANDVIVTSPVQTLWLTELKLQSGGGE